MGLWEMGVTGGAMVLAVLAVRKIFQNKLPGNTFVVLWMAVALRLLLPVAVPVPWNAYTLLEHFEGVGQWGEALGLAAPKEAEPADWQQGIQAGEGQLPTGNNVVEEVQGDAGVQEGAKGLQKFLPAWNLIYLAGALLCAVFYIFTYLKCYREFRAALPVEDLDVLSYVRSFPMKRKVQVRETRLVATPMTYGVRRPVILLPKGIKWESDRQMRLVLTHELAHIRRFDVVWKLVLAMAVCIHWCNPLVWVMNILASRDIELVCDEKVVRHFGQDSRSVYALSLISLAERKGRPVTWGAGFGKDAMEERIVAIMKKKIYSGKAVAGAAILVVFVVVLFATSTKQTGDAYLAEGNLAQEGSQSSPIQIPAQAVPVWSGDLREEEGRRLAGFLENAYENEGSEYQKFGLLYDDKENCFRYQGKVVGYFEDEIEPGMFRRFTDGRGAVGLVAQREASGAIEGFQEVGLNAVSAEDLDAGGHSYLPQTGVAFSYKSDDATESAGDMAVDFPKEYEKYGVTQEGKYKGKWIKVLYDAEHYVYTSGCDEEEAVYLFVKRDSKGKIISFQEMEKEEMQKAIKIEGIEF